MKKTFSIIIFIFVFNFIVQAAEKVEYYAVVDTGSSGSRIHLYKHIITNNGKLDVTEIELKNNKVKPGLSSLAGNSTMVGEYIKPLIESVKGAISINRIPENDINFYATAGMRTISPQLQTKLYSTINKYLKQNTNFKIKNIATIPGGLEGVFDWIALNYLSGSFEGEKSIGVMDLGGASIEIAFATDLPINDANDKFNISIGSIDYTIYSHSYLGLGQDLARSQYLNNPDCFYKDYPLPDGEYGSGKFMESLIQIKPLIVDVHNVDKPSTVIPDADHFVGISGFYYTANSKLFGMGQNLSIADLEAKGKIVGQLRWKDIVKLYPEDSYLFTYLFSVAYITEFLKDGLGFNKNTKFRVLNDVEGKDLSWTLGATIYFAEKNDIKTEKAKPNITFIQQKKAS